MDTGEGSTSPARRRLFTAKVLTLLDACWGLVLVFVALSVEQDHECEHSAISLNLWLLVRGPVDIVGSSSLLFICVMPLWYRVYHNLHAGAVEIAVTLSLWDLIWTSVGVGALTRTKCLGDGDALSIFILVDCILRLPWLCYRAYVFEMIKRDTD